VARATELRDRAEARLCADDADWYYVPLAGFHAVEVVLGAGSGPALLALTDETGEVVLDEQSGEAGELRVEGTGPFWIVVHGNARTAERDYTITVW
jgi:hypothetical protein